jgi:hypothetical protein
MLASRLRLCAPVVVLLMTSGCAVPQREEAVLLTIPPSEVAPGGTRRISDDGAGGLILPDGSRVRVDQAGGFSLPNGAYIAPDASGGLMLPNGTRCVSDREGGYVCP